MFTLQFEASFYTAEILYAAITQNSTRFSKCMKLK
jgi:hypothetical protein